MTWNNYYNKDDLIFILLSLLIIYNTYPQKFCERLEVRNEI